MTYWQPSIYERNQLLKYGFAEADLAKVQPMPVEYLTGRVVFAGLEIKVTPDVLIPRVETEELLPLIANFLGQNKINYLEVATGSGAITTAVLDRHKHQLANWWVSDISSKALAVARQNLSSVYDNDDLDQHLLSSDLLSEFPDLKLDLLVANLPYLPAATMVNLPASVRDFEPKLALDGGVDGFALINNLLKQVRQREILNEAGLILLEVDATHDLDFLRTHYPWIMDYFQVEAFKDQFGRQRFLRLQKKS